MVKWTLPLLAFLFAATAQAQPLGPSFLGICSPSWPCKQSLAVFNGLPVKATGWLVGTFGNACPCGEKFLALPGKKFVRIHVANCTCFPERGRRCLKGEPFRGESISSADRKIRSRNKEILRRYRNNLLLAREQLANADDKTTVMISLCLETVLSLRARSIMLKEARKVFPGGTFVDNPVAGPCLPGLVCERHGFNPPVTAPCLADTDGDNAFTRFPARKPQCSAQFLWAPPFNLIDERRGFQPPRQRRKAPTKKDFQRIAAAIRK